MVGISVLRSSQLAKPPLEFYETCLLILAYACVYGLFGSRTVHGVAAGSAERFCRGPVQPSSLPLFYICIGVRLQAETGAVAAS